MNFASLSQGILMGFALTSWLISLNHAEADELVYIFKGNMATTAIDAHPSISPGEGFVAVFTIDPSAIDVDSDSESGLYPDAVLAGRIFFVGGFVSAYDYTGADVWIDNKASHDSITIFLNEFNFFQARLEGGGALINDSLPPSGTQFDSWPDPATQAFTAFVYSDGDGLFGYESADANNICFRSKTGIPFAHVTGNPWYDVAGNWLPGLNSGPPTEFDNAVFCRADSGGNSVWWDSITGDRTCANLCHNRGTLTFDNRDGGNYTLSVTNTATVSDQAHLILGDGTDTVNLDIANFMIVDGNLNANTGTSVDIAFAADIGLQAFGQVIADGPGTSVNTGIGAMYVGVNNFGSLTVRNGATSHDQGSPRIGAAAGGNGVVSVEDSMSHWNVNGTILIGGIAGSIGLLNVQDQGSVTANLDIQIGGDGDGQVALSDSAVLQAGNEILINTGANLKVSGTDICTIDAPVVRNSGLIEIDSNIGADIDASVENTGAIHSLGISNNFIFLNLIHEGTEIFTDTNAAIRINGAASGNGPYTGNGTVAFRGQCNLGSGDGVGTVASVPFAGDVQLVSTNTANIDIGGTSSGEFDQLTVDGDVVIDGNLSVQQVGSFVPASGDTFAIIEIGGSQTGTFTGLPQDAIVGNIGGVDLRITYSGGDGNDVELYVGNGILLGDVNLDGVVNLLDVQPFINLLSSGGYLAQADINMDGVVNLLDVSGFIEVLAGS